jgi:D-3-phosphoglycerate dehydrogenase / 2-oxoglutarate reductase
VSKKVLFIDSTHASLPEGLTKLGIECDFQYGWSKDEILQQLPSYIGIVIRSRIKITADIIDAGTNLKFIARVGAGMENIDVTYAESKGVKCLHAPEGNKDAVAEHALAMLLSLFNNILIADAQVRKGIWKREENRGVELNGKTVGIIGYGNMGSAFAQRLQGFGVKVLVYDKYKKGFGNSFIQEVDLETIYKDCDVVSLHLPLTAETTFMANDNFFNSFSKNIYFINTARGKITETSALVKALKSGKVKGACIDVIEYESVSFENIDTATITDDYKYLLSVTNVILSPHIAGWTHESNEKMATVLVEKIKTLV